MPIMDGVETTRRIRLLEADKEEQTTIVALTAHALASEKQELLNAGMNDYVTKPINEHLLLETIHKWTGYHAKPMPAHQEGVRNSNSSTANSSTAPLQKEERPTLAPNKRLKGALGSPAAAVPTVVGGRLKARERQRGSG